MRVLIAVLFGLFLNNCYAGWDNWSDDDRKLFIASNIAIVADWGTTLDIARNPTKYTEVGPIARNVIGEHPSVSGVNLYFIARTILNYYTTDRLQDDYRRYYLIFTIVDHGAAAIHNYQIGLRIKF